MPGYAALSDNYDAYFFGEYLLKIKKKYHLYLLKSGINKGRILDAGCGTGLLAGYFAENGYETHGVDLSGEMLEIAKKKYPDSSFFQMDISDELPDFSYNAVVSSLDVVNHLTDIERVKSFFQNAYEHLIINGVFVFDINTYKKFSREYADKRYVYSSHHSLCVWDNSYDDSTKLCRFDLKLYEKTGERYVGKNESFYERYYAPEYIRMLLLLTGFSYIEIKYMDNGTRCFFIAIKKREKS